MASADAFTPIHDYLVAQWGATTPLVFENEDKPTAAEPAAFVFVEVFGDFYQQASIGAEPVVDNLWREAGQLLMHVLTPRGTGSATARTYAKQLVDLFRGQEIAGIIFRDASIGAGEPGDDDGNYYRMTATIDWQRDEN